MRRAPGTASAISAECSGGISRSSAPASTSAGHSIEGSSGRESGQPIEARCCRTNTSGPVSAAMARTVSRN